MKLHAATAVYEDHTYREDMQRGISAYPDGKKPKFRLYLPMSNDSHTRTYTFNLLQSFAQHILVSSLKSPATKMLAKKQHYQPVERHSFMLSALFQFYWDYKITSSLRKHSLNSLRATRKKLSDASINNTYAEAECVVSVPVTMCLLPASCREPTKQRTISGHILHFMKVCNF